MKKIMSIAMGLFLAATLSSFSLSDLANSSQSTVSEATASGQACGKAIKGLYTQYKADGKLDMKNATNLLNIASLSASIAQIKDQEKDTDFYKEFATGVVTGSTQIVTTSNVDNVLSTLSGLDLSSLVSSSETTSSSSTTTTSSSASFPMMSGITPSSSNGTSDTSESSAAALSGLTSLLGGLLGN